MNGRRRLALWLAGACLLALLGAYQALVYMDVLRTPGIPGLPRTAPRATAPATPEPTKERKPWPSPTSAAPPATRAPSGTAPGTRGTAPGRAKPQNSSEPRPGVRRPSTGKDSSTDPRASVTAAPPTSRPTASNAPQPQGPDPVGTVLQIPGDLLPTVRSLLP